MMLPAAAFAQTTTQSQIESLLSQIRTLQAQLKVLIASSSANIRMEMKDHMPPGQMGKMACIMLNRNLRAGAEGDDVRKLQEMLHEDKENGFEAEATGFFGPVTARAIAKWQMRMGIASSSDGSVGPLTRGFFERACGQGLKDKDDDEAKREKVRGEITAKTDSSITIKPANGDSRVVNVTASTTIHVFTSATSTPTIGSMSDLVVGKGAAAAGMVNADGSITAREIKVGTLPAPPPLVERIHKMFKFDHRGKKVDE
jgi:peptidoglycan hydrolase-like protein with peptidoglycan-binding domain